MPQTEGNTSVGNLQNRFDSLENEVLSTVQSGTNQNIKIENLIDLTKGIQALHEKSEVKIDNLSSTVNFQQLLIGGAFTVVFIGFITVIIDTAIWRSDRYEEYVRVLVEQQKMETEMHDDIEELQSQLNLIQSYLNQKLLEEQMQSESKAVISAPPASLP